MSIAEFDHLNEKRKRELLLQCCGSSSWANKMLTVFPVEDVVELLEASEEKWNECTKDGLKEAFEHHPKIGDANSLKQKAFSTKEWASAEQSGVNDASQNTLQELAYKNKEYEQKFGFIFIVCATGKSAGEMLDLLKNRLNNSAEKEIEIAAAEQLKITKLRLEKLFEINEPSDKYEV